MIWIIFTHHFYHLESLRDSLGFEVLLQCHFHFPVRSPNELLAPNRVHFLNEIHSRNELHFLHPRHGCFSCETKRHFSIPRQINKMRWLGIPFLLFSSRPAKPIFLLYLIPMSYLNISATARVDIFLGWYLIYQDKFGFGEQRFPL